MNYNKEFILHSINELGKVHGVYEAFSDVVICCAYSFANRVDMKEERENEYLRRINKYNSENRKLFSKILAALINEFENAEEPIDILGDIYENLNLVKKSAAQFFTPLSVCNVMAKITLNGKDSKQIIKDKGYITISDPACGSGRNLYAAYRELLDNNINANNILLIGDDIDLTCCCMTYIQLSLMGASAIINHQNTLTNERYDSFYTISYAVNKNLRNKIEMLEEDEELEA